jgi:ParB family chromosome partitioning protein
VSELLVIPLVRIRPNINQVRRTFHRIEELARSIAQYGLLQNLVVRPLPEAGYYEIVAGERRYRALTLLAKDGRLEPAEVRCFLISGDGAYENIIENVVREDVPVWEVGRTYLSFHESGLTQAEIAARVGKTQGHVSTPSPAYSPWRVASCTHAASLRCAPRVDRSESAVVLRR